MIYLWETPEYYPNKDIAAYDKNHSPDRFLLMQGEKLNPTQFSQCYAYNRSSLVDLNDDVFIREVVRRFSQSAYIFTKNEMFSFAGGTATKINISIDNINKIKEALSLTNKAIDKEPKILSDMDMKTIDTLLGQSLLSRTPIFNLDVTTAVIQKKYDCIHNNSAAPLVNQKIIDILLKFAPDDIQFFDAEIRCKDSTLNNYKLLNLTHKIIGIDHEKSSYTNLGTTDLILTIKHLIYKKGCMREYNLARDAEFLGNILVNENVKQAFEEANIKGVRLITPEDYYQSFYDEDGRRRI